MKTIGLLGGMSWESTVTYYQLLNRMARDRLGGLHSAKLLLHSFDFAEIEAFQAAGDWEGASAALSDAARGLCRAGADCILLCTNTMHRMADEVEAASGLPLIHIADATAAAVIASSARRPLLLATRYTMEQAFYRGRLRDRGVDALIPDEAGRTVVHDVIYEELCRGVVRAESRRAYHDVIARGRDAGADAVIFGCTEIGLLLSPADIDAPSFDTTALHAAAAIDFALAA